MRRIKVSLTPILIVIVGALTICPVSMLLIGSFSKGLGAFGQFTLEKYIPLKFSFRILTIVPMMIPHILFAVSWVIMLNPSNGILNIILKELFNLEGSPFNIYTLPGM